MTNSQIVLWTCLYFVALLATVYFTRATARRVAGALAGGAVVGLAMLAMVRWGNAIGWWHVPFGSSRYFLPLFYLGSLISCSPIYLVTWRVARRFGSRGLAVSVAITAIIGPPRDYLIAATFPKWMVFGPGIAPIIADSAAYVVIVALGHGVMRLVAGPSCDDGLARRT